MGLAERPDLELGMQSKYYFSQTDCLFGKGLKCIVRAMSVHLHLPVWTSAVDKKTAVSKDASPILFQSTEFPLEEARFAADSLSLEEILIL